MSLVLAQDYEYLSNQTWRWWVWLEGDPEELDQVTSVEYHLHPTFPNPVRKVKDRESNFRLQSQGWGIFNLKALVELHDGSSEQLSHMLELRYPDDLESAASRGATSTTEDKGDLRSIFLSSGTADGAVAADLRDSLVRKGVHVLSDDDVGSSGSWSLQIDEAMREADAVVVLSSDVPSSWVEREVSAATQQGTKLIPVVVGENAVVPESLQTLSYISLSDESGVDEAADSILRAIEP